VHVIVSSSACRCDRYLTADFAFSELTRFRFRLLPKFGSKFPNFCWPDLTTYISHFSFLSSRSLCPSTLPLSPPPRELPIRNYIRLAFKFSFTNRFSFSFPSFHFHCFCVCCCLSSRSCEERYLSFHHSTVSEWGSSSYSQSRRSTP